VAPAPLSGGHAIAQITRIGAGREGAIGVIEALVMLPQEIRPVVAPLGVHTMVWM